MSISARRTRLSRRLQGFAIICAMRERTPFPRAVIEALPDLKLLITTGMRNASIDLEAAKARGVVVCGTPAFGNATAAIATGLMLELARHIGYRERTAQGRRARGKPQSGLISKA